MRCYWGRGYLLLHNCINEWFYLLRKQIPNWRNEIEKHCERTGWIKPCSHTSLCVGPSVCPEMTTRECETIFVQEHMCVVGCWHSLGPFFFFLQSDPFGRERRTNQIIVLVWHWVDPSVGQWADYPGWEWEWLNSELHPNEYIMSPLSLSTPRWNKGMRSTSALMRWWNSTSLIPTTKARLIAMQMTFSNKRIGVATKWECGWDRSTAAQG